MLARMLHGDPKTVRNVAHIFIEDGLDAALFDEEKAGRPIAFDDRGRAGIATKHQKTQRSLTSFKSQQEITTLVRLKRMGP